jgi:hypothetical protein
MGNCKEKSAKEKNVERARRKPLVIELSGHLLVRINMARQDSAWGAFTIQVQCMCQGPVGVDTCLLSDS